MNINTDGYCLCGCGNRTNIVLVNVKAYGLKKGDFRPFLKGHHTKILKPNKEKFMRHVLKDVSGCWLWTAHIDEHGYGRYTLDGVFMGAHRAAYKIFVGEIPLGLLALHKCDNPQCCNPEHLFIGTQKDNMQDKIKKGRANWALGERCGSSKLNNEKVLKIKNSIEHSSVLARVFGVDPRTIRDIKNNITWRHL